MSLDKFHYHEALHTAFQMCEFIDVSLVQHPVFESAPEEIKELVRLAQDHLTEYYKWAAEEQDKLEDS